MSQLFLPAWVFSWVILEVGGVIQVERVLCTEEFLPGPARAGDRSHIFT